MLRLKGLAIVAVIALSSAGALADVFHDYEGYAEGFLGTSFTDTGATYRDANQVTGFFPDGNPFTPADLGDQFIIENATLLYNDYPSFGSPVNGLTFGSAFIPGDNLTIGALASIYIDLPELTNAASLDIAYYENGPWGGIEYILEAELGGTPVASDSFVISDLGGRDNPAIATMSVGGVEFDSLHLYAWLNGDYSAPRGIIDNLSTTAVPEPGAIALLLTVLPLFGRRR